MRIKVEWLVLLLIAAVMVSSCSAKSRYERMLKRELASGVRNDSLFMGLYLGMTQKDFYTRCWNLNHQGLVKQGPSNATVEYVLRGELKYPGTMNFYPKFTDGKISEMPVKYNYTGWSPWSKQLSSDNLEADVLRYYEKKYGKGFISIKHPDRGLAYVKIDGNRRISIFKENDLNVWAVFTDMLVKGDTLKQISEPAINNPDSTKDSDKK